MYYFTYKTTNIIDGKYYIGMHKTSRLNDGYIGSGKLLKLAIKKYGRENFIREIIDFCDQEWKMHLAERILVVPDREVNYNLDPGGLGGPGKIPSLETRAKLSVKKLGIPKSESHKQNMRKPKSKEHAEKIRQVNLIRTKHPMSGKIQSKETRRKMSEKRVQYWENRRAA